MIGLVLSAALVLSSNAFLQPRFTRNVIVRQEIALSAIKPDLFSDDLFDDEDDAPKKVAKDAPPRKEKYLDQKWKLADEDAKEFDGWDKMTPNEVYNARAKMFDPADKLPILALIYNFKREFNDADLTATHAEHTSYCESFKRLFNSELLNTSKGRGMVLIWGGLSMEDQDLRTDIMNFMEEDPFVVKNIVDNWDLQEMDPEILFAEVSMGVPGYDEMPEQFKVVEKRWNKERAVEAERLKQARIATNYKPKGK